MSASNGAVRRVRGGVSGEREITVGTVGAGRGTVGAMAGSGGQPVAAARRASAGRSVAGRPRGQVAKATRLWWAYSGVGLTLGLSGWLNGLAFSSVTGGAAGWVLGVVVPVLVLVFSRVSVGAWEGRRRGPAVLAGLAALSILALSVQHLAASIAGLTGESLVTAYLMAVAIDLGLVACEWWTVR